MRKICLILILALLMPILTTGCGNSQSQASNNSKVNASSNAAPQVAKPDKIRIEFGNGAMGLSSCVLYIAIKKNILQDEFAKDGIKIEFVQTSGSGTDVANAIGAGKIDIGAIGDQPVLVSRANGIDIKAVGVYAQGILGGPDRYIQLMARNDSKIKTIKDLKGKKVAVPVGTNQHVVLARYLNFYGMKQSDIQLVNMQSADIRTALATGSLEVGMLSQPNIATVVDKGIAHMVEDNTGLTKNYNVYVVETGFAKKYPDIVRRFLKVHIKAKKWIDDNPDEFLKIASESLKLDKEIVKKALKGLAFDLQITDDTYKSFEATNQFLADNGISRGKTDVKDAFDTSFLKDIGVLK